MTLYRSYEFLGIRKTCDYTYSWVLDSTTCCLVVWLGFGLDLASRWVFRRLPENSHGGCRRDVAW